MTGAGTASASVKPDTQRFSLSVRLLEDMHSGSGSTVHELDAVQQRDRYGNPVVRDRHLRGLLREEGYALVKMGAATMRDVNRLFGQPGNDTRSSVLISSLRLSPGVWHELRQIASTARRSLDRGPLEDTLRLHEHVAAHTEFVAEMELLDAELAPLLERCMRRVSAIGANRTKGDGRILAKFQALPERAAPTACGATGEPEADTCRLRMLIRAEEPICMANTATPDNVIPTECYVRGQAVQGAFVSWALRRGQPAAAAQLLATEDAPEFSNSYPLPILDPVGAQAAMQSLDVRPVPLDTMTSKPPPQSGSGWPWWAESASEKEQDESAAKPKRPGDHEFLFRSNTAESYTRYIPLIRPYMRNDAGHSQRTGDEQQLYTVEEIAEHTLFLAEITFTDPAQARSFELAFAAVIEGKSWLTLGRGGGLARILKAEWLSSQQPSTRDRSERPPKGLRVILDSDLIMRGPLLGFRDKLDLELLADASGFDPEQAAKLKEERATFDTVEIHGFNPVSAGPRQPAIALRRGSVLEVTGPEAALRALAAALSARPVLGERSKEGFGRIRVESSELEIARASQEDKPADPIVSLNERALHRAEADRRLIEPNGPSRKQWTDFAKQALGASSVDELNALIGTRLDHAEKLGGVAWQKVDLVAMKEAIAEILATTQDMADGPDDDDDRVAAVHLREARLYLVALAIMSRPEKDDMNGDGGYG